MPAVSVSLTGIPESDTCSSIVSRVVPGISVTIARFSFTKKFKSEDLPTFGFPAIATEMPSRIILPSRA